MALFIEERNTSLRTQRRVRKQKLGEKGAAKSRGNPENPPDELQRRRDALEKKETRQEMESVIVRQEKKEETRRREKANRPRETQARLAIASSFC